MKHYGKITYFFIALVNLTGLQLDTILTNRYLKKNRNTIKANDLEYFQIRKEVIVLLKKNFFKILFSFKRKTSSSKHYLKTF